MTFRNITVNGSVYQYYVGKSHTKIILPNGKGIVVDHSEMTGLSWDSIERGQYKGYFSITPAQVAAYLERV